MGNHKGNGATVETESLLLMPQNQTSCTTYNISTPIFQTTNSFQCMCQRYQNRKTNIFSSSANSLQTEMQALHQNTKFFRAWPHLKQNLSVLVTNNNLLDKPQSQEYLGVLVIARRLLVILEINKSHLLIQQHKTSVFLHIKHHIR